MYAASHFASTVESRYRLIVFVQHTSACVDRYPAHRVVDAGADFDSVEASILPFRPTSLISAPMEVSDRE